MPAVDPNAAMWEEFTRRMEESHEKMAKMQAALVAESTRQMMEESKRQMTMFQESLQKMAEEQGKISDWKREVDVDTTSASPTYSLTGATADDVPVATSELLELSLTRCSTEVLNEGTGVPVLAVLPTATATTSSTTRANKEAEKQHITNHRFNIAGHDSLQYGIGTWVDAFMSGCGTRISSYQIMLEVMLHGHRVYSPDDGKFSDCLMDVNKTFSILPNIGNAIHGQGNKWPKPPWRLCIEVFKSWFGKMQLTSGYLLEKSPWFLYDEAGKDMVGLEEVSYVEFVRHDKKTLEFALPMLSYAKDQMSVVPGEGHIGLTVAPPREVLPRPMEIQVVFTMTDREFTMAGFRSNIVVFVAECLSPSFSLGSSMGITLIVYGSPYSAGGVLYATRLIHAYHGEGVKQFFCESLCNTSFVANCADSAGAGNGMRLLMCGIANEKAGVMLAYAPDIQQENIILGIVVAVNGSEEEEADTLIEQMTIDQYLILQIYCDSGRDNDNLEIIIMHQFMVCFSDSSMFWDPGGTKFWFLHFIFWRFCYKIEMVISITALLEFAANKNNSCILTFDPGITVHYVGPVMITRTIVASMDWGSSALTKEIPSTVTLTSYLNYSRERKMGFHMWRRALELLESRSVNKMDSCVFEGEEPFLTESLLDENSRQQVLELQLELMSQKIDSLLVWYGVMPAWGQAVIQGGKDVHRPWDPVNCSIRIGATLCIANRVTKSTTLAELQAWFGSKDIRLPWDPGDSKLLDVGMVQVLEVCMVQEKIFLAEEKSMVKEVIWHDPMFCGPQLMLAAHFPTQVMELIFDLASDLQFSVTVLNHRVSTRASQKSSQWLLQWTGWLKPMATWKDEATVMQFSLGTSLGQAGFKGGRNVSNLKATTWTTGWRGRVFGPANPNPLHGPCVAVLAAHLGSVVNRAREGEKGTDLACL